jgi:hypothetical protein
MWQWEERRFCITEVKVSTIKSILSNFFFTSKCLELVHYTTTDPSEFLRGPLEFFFFYFWFVHPTDIRGSTS